jgi:ligand-binding sensor domain-containing protein
LPDPGPDDDSANRQVDDLVWDREGNLWLATVRYGLFRLRPAAVRVVGVPEGLPDRNVTVFQEDASGAVWAGTRGGGLARIDGTATTAYGAARNVPTVVTALLRDSSGDL